MFDINKLKEWKSALDEGFLLEKGNCKILIRIEFQKTDKKYVFTKINLNPEEYFKIKNRISDQNFNKFCEKVAAAILEVQ